MLKIPIGEDILISEAPVLKLIPTPTVACVEVAAAASWADITNDVFLQTSLKTVISGVHVYPGSVIHNELHPSPSWIFLSSHFSNPIIQIRL